MEIVYTGEKDLRAYKSVIAEVVGELIASDEKAVWLDADLMSCCGAAKHYGKSDRVINCGIAEQDMIGIAAGLSASGFKPYCHSFACFASRRCFDQTLLSAAYGKCPITILGTDPGVQATYNGGTHMPFEDMALMRAIPGATVVDVTDVPMLRWFLLNSKEMEGVKYIRTGRKVSYQVYADGTEFVPGKGAVLRDGKDVTIVASGMMVHEALQAAKALAGDGIEAAVIDPVTIKPLDTELIRTYAAKTGAVITAENHNRIGGLTSAVADTIVGIPLKFDHVAIEDEFGEVGLLDYLQERFGLTSANIVAKAKNLLEK